MSERNYLRGELVEDETVISMDDLCRHCMVQAEEIVRFVREGILDPDDDAIRPGRAQAWHFHISSVRRVRTAVRLQRDLGVNLAGAALALELLERIEQLERLGAQLERGS